MSYRRIPFSFLILAAIIGIFWTPAVAIADIREDQQTAAIFAYGRIEDDADPSSAISPARFAEHMRELANGGYTVLSLATIVDALKSGRDIPTNAIALTFDGGHASFLDRALPLLEEYGFPYTVFIAPGQVREETEEWMGWKDIKTLLKGGQADFGLHPAAYTRLGSASKAEILRQINAAKTIYRRETGQDSPFFAYPFGEYSRMYRDIAAGHGFKAAFAQHSGPAFVGSDRFALPRFVMTDRYGDIERFRIAASSLPFPVEDVSPPEQVYGSLSPAIGFTLPPSIRGDARKISCFVSGQSAPNIEILGNSRVELRLTEPLSGERVRVNCTIPAILKGDEDKDVRWRWFGLLLTPEGDQSAD